MNSSRPRIAVPEPTSADPGYNQRSWPQYAHAIESAGGIAVLVPLNESRATLARIASGCSGILLPGSPADVDPEKYDQQAIPECGSKDPGRESADDLLLQDAFNLQKPILGICYGLQALNVWLNGSLIQNLPETGMVNHHPGSAIRHAHTVMLAPESRLAVILSRSSDLEHGVDDLHLRVNSSHHQAVDRPGDQMEVVGRSAADGVIEALEGRMPEQFVLGIQWHPERCYGESAASRAIFDALIAAARTWRPRDVRESTAE